MIGKRATLMLPLVLAASAVLAPAALQAGTLRSSTKGRAAAPSNPVPSVRSELQAAYAKLAEVIRAKDIEGYTALHAPNFSVSLPDGTTQSRGQVEQNMRTAMRQAKGTPSITFRIEKLDSAGEKATVVVRQHFEGATVISGGKTVRARSHILSRDTWVKTAEGWKQTQVVVLDADGTVSGGRYRLGWERRNPSARPVRTRGASSAARRRGADPRG